MQTNRQEAKNKKLTAFSDISNWAIDQGWEAAELRMTWNEWLDELMDGHALWSPEPGVTLETSGAKRQRVGIWE